MKMETSTERELSNIIFQLIELYDEADAIITEKKSASLLKPIIRKTNFLCADLDKLSINFPTSSSESAEKETLDRSIAEQRIKKGFFDSKVADYMRAADLLSKEVASILSAPRTLRLYASSRSKHSSQCWAPQVFF